MVQRNATTMTRRTWPGAAALISRYAAGTVLVAAAAALIVLIVRMNRPVAPAELLALALAAAAGGGLAFLPRHRAFATGDDRLPSGIARFHQDAVFRECDAWIAYWDLYSGDMWLPAGAAARLGITEQRGLCHYNQLREFVKPGFNLYTAVMQALSQRQEEVRLTFEVRHPRGKTITAEMTGRFFRSESGSPVLAFMIRDVAAGNGRAVAAELRADQLAEAIASIPESVAVWDAQDRLVHCNAKFRELYGLRESDAKAGVAFAAIQAHASGIIPQGPVGLDGARKSTNGAYSARLSSGIWLQICERPVPSGGFVSLGTDITALKLSEQRISQREQQMKATVNDLEESRRQLQEQTRQLAELAEKYSDEKLNAEAASRSKSEFLANISHELRTPLNAIIGFSEMMSHEMFGRIGNPKYLEYAGDIGKSGRYLVDVINDILDMSKIEAGRVTLVMEPLVTGEIVEDSMRVVSQTARDRHITLTHAGSKGIELPGDRRSLKQVMINLMANAIKFTPVGGEVTVRAYRYKGTVRIAITDTGVGIPKTEIARLGRPFEQVENQFAKAHKGTGLGLAISRSIIELHGGKLEIKSKVGEGTTVMCILPASQQAEMAESEAA